jgi:hypothetical protein
VQRPSSENGARRALGFGEPFVGLMAAVTRDPTRLATRLPASPALACLPLRHATNTILVSVDCKDCLEEIYDIRHLIRLNAGNADGGDALLEGSGLGTAPTALRSPGSARPMMVPVSQLSADKDQICGTKRWRTRDGISSAPPLRAGITAGRLRRDGSVGRRWQPERGDQLYLDHRNHPAARADDHLDAGQPDQ